jgi:hypothetical protein
MHSVHVCAVIRAILLGAIVRYLLCRFGVFKVDFCVWLLAWWPWLLAAQEELQQAAWQLLVQKILM